MRIKSVKVLRDRVTVAWETPVGESGEVVESAIKNGEDPTPELVNAIAELKEPACEALEFPKAYRDTFTMKGLSLSYGADGERSATLIGSKKLRSGKATTICTPDLRERTDAEQKGGAFMAEDLLAIVEDVVAAAEAYANGARAQTKLPVEEPS